MSATPYAELRKKLLKKRRVLHDADLLYTTLELINPDGPEAAEAISSLLKALAPFAAMGRVMETRAVVTFGKMPPDSEIVCESSGEAGMGILTMGHFRDAAALFPNAPGWGGYYIRPFDRAALNSDASTQTGGQE